jgi:hypothetical protein
MIPQERELIADLFDRLAQLENQPRLETLDCRRLANLLQGPARLTQLVSRANSL